MSELCKKTKLRIYTDGIFDLCHYGHGNVFKQIKDHFGDCTVIVGILNDYDCHKYKGITVMNNFESVELIRNRKKEIIKLDGKKGQKEEVAEFIEAITEKKDELAINQV